MKLCITFTAVAILVVSCRNESASTIDGGFGGNATHAQAIIDSIAAPFGERANAAKIAWSHETAAYAQGFAKLIVTETNKAEVWNAANSALEEAPAGVRNPWNYTLDESLLGIKYDTDSHTYYLDCIVAQRVADLHASVEVTFNLRGTKR